MITALLKKSGRKCWSKQTDKRDFMKLFAIDDKSEIEIRKTGDEQYSSFICSARISGCGARYYAENEDQLFLETKEFLTAFNHFVQGDTDSVSLQGTYDTELTFLRIQQGRNILLKFCIGYITAFYAENVEYKFTGAFEIRPESLNAYQLEFMDMFAYYA